VTLWSDAWRLTAYCPVSLVVPVVDGVGVQINRRYEIKERERGYLGIEVTTRGSNGDTAQSAWRNQNKEGRFNKCHTTVGRGLASAWRPNNSDTDSPQYVRIVVQ
jgi:hypothetical protein